MKKVHGNDSFQRINYLYQISKHTASTHPELSSYYGHLIESIAKKSVSKIHPEIKRQICKKCKVILLPDISTSVTIKNKNNRKILNYKCFTCGTERRLPAKKDHDHTIWAYKPEAVVEVIKYDCKSKKNIN